MDTYRIVQKPSRKIIGIQCRTAPEEAPYDIPRLWEKFYKENISNQISNKTSNEIIALYCDYEKDHTKPYSLIIGCPVNSIQSIPKGMVSKTTPGGTYALFKAVGAHPKSLIETWKQIWTTSLQRTYSGDYEVYGENFTSKAPQEIEILIAIEKK